MGDHPPPDIVLHAEIDRSRVSLFNSGSSYLRRSATMNVSSPISLIPLGEEATQTASDPETLARSKTTRTPRSLPSGVPGLPHPKQRRAALWKSAVINAGSPTNATPRNVTQEFKGILEPYQQREPSSEGSILDKIHQQNSEVESQPVEQTREDSDKMADQRETVNIAFNPNWSRPEQPQPAKSTIQPANPFDLGYQETMFAESAKYYRKPQIVVAERPVSQAEEANVPTYESDWITAEDQDITDRDYYDQDAGEASAYTHQAVQIRSGVPKIISYDVPDDDKAFDHPRKAPSFNPRSTRVIVKEDVAFFMAVRDGLEPPPDTPQATPPRQRESGRSSPVAMDQDIFVRQQDVDFFMSLLAGSEPPPASPETKSIVQLEDEALRRSEELAVHESEKRRREELEANQKDLDFLAALLQ